MHFKRINPTADLTVCKRVTDFVKTLPAEVWEELVELEREGKLEEILHNVVVHARAVDVASRCAARMVRAEVLPFFYMWRTGRMKRMTLTSGCLNARSVAARRQSATACSVPDAFTI